MPGDFTDVVHQHHDEIYRYLWRLQLSRNDVDADANAADLTQEAFQRAYQAFDKLRPNSNVRAWLFRIATNCARSDWRRSQRMPLADSPVGALTSSEPGPEALFSLNEEQHRLLTALQSLPFKQRNAVSLRYLEQMSYAGIASILECSQSSARANVYQGLRRLRQTLTKEAAR